MTLLFLYVFVALGFSFLCSIAEAALLSVTPAYIALLEQKGQRAGTLLRHFKHDVNRPLAAILTLNTIAHTVGAAGAGAQAANVFGNQYVGLASAILTLLILVFSEIIPKTLGAVYWRQLGPAVAHFLKYLIFLLYPFVILSEKLTRHLSGTRQVAGMTREEFSAMAELGAREGQLASRESRILKNLLRFRAMRSRDVMTPRTVIFSLPQTLRVSEFFEHYADPRFSRIPLYDDNPDEINGFVLRGDLLLAQARGEQQRTLKEFRRHLLAVPDSASVFTVFDYLLDHRAHILLVVDEYGTPRGLVTLEDVLETLIGFEIVDENDHNVDMQALARDLWEKRARSMGLPIRETSAENNTSEKLSVPVDNNPSTEERKSEHD